MFPQPGRADRTQRCTTSTARARSLSQPKRNQGSVNPSAIPGLWNTDGEVRPVTSTEIGDKILAGVCPWCERRDLTSPARHTVAAHGIDRYRLRDLMGVARTASICSSEHSARVRERTARMPTSFQRSPLTADEESRILSLRREGQTTRAIGRALGRGDERVRSVFERAGLPTSLKWSPLTADEESRILSLRREGQTTRAIARALRRSDARVLSVLERAGMLTSRISDRKRNAVALLAEGLSQRDVARREHISAGTIRRMLRSDG